MIFWRLLCLQPLLPALYCMWMLPFQVCFAMTPHFMQSAVILFEIVLCTCDPSGPAFSVYGQNKPSMTPFGQPMAGPGITNNPFMVSTVRPLNWLLLSFSFWAIAPGRGAFKFKQPWIESSCCCFLETKRRQPGGSLRGWEEHGPGDITHGWFLELCVLANVFWRVESNKVREGCLLYAYFA